MGNRFTKRQDGPVNIAESAAAEQPETTQPGGNSEATLAQQATEKLDVIVGEAATLVACLPTEECLSECKAAAVAADEANDVEPLSSAKETLVSVSDTSPPESEPVPEAQLAPEPVDDPEPTSNPEADAEAHPEPISEPAPAPAEALEQEIDLLAQEPLPEPVMTSPPLVDLGAPDATPEPSPVAIPDPDKSSDIPAAEGLQEDAEAAVTSTIEPEKSEEASESLEEPEEAEAAGDSEQHVSDLSEESVSGLLKQLVLTGNDVVTDLIQSDVKAPDDIADMSTSTELM